MCKYRKPIEGRNGYNDDTECLANGRYQCDKDPVCFGLSYPKNALPVKLQMCLTNETERKPDGWRTMLKIEGNPIISFSLNC